MTPSLIWAGTPTTIFAFNGSIDEARIASGVCSASWISATAMTVAATATMTSSAAVTPSAALTCANSASGLLLAWPESSGTFVVYTTTNLTPPAVWLSATNTTTYVVAASGSRSTFPRPSPERSFTGCRRIGEDGVRPSLSGNGA